MIQIVGQAHEQIVDSRGGHGHGSGVQIDDRAYKTEFRTGLEAERDAVRVHNGKFSIVFQFPRGQDQRPRGCSLRRAALDRKEIELGNAHPSLRRSRSGRRVCSNGSRSSSRSSSSSSSGGGTISLLRHLGMVPKGRLQKANKNVHVFPGAVLSKTHPDGPRRFSVDEIDVVPTDVPARFVVVDGPAVVQAQGNLAGTGVAETPGPELQRGMVQRRQLGDLVVPDHCAVAPNHVEGQGRSPAPRRGGDLFVVFVFVFVHLLPFGLYVSILRIQDCLNPSD
mmetsp:Transcript_28205/g.66214  ORF Transcript_28205/g.66214 Transcript_28205/m.66214 type:complete len:280 (+) Transcript_28205:801-1640(+)